jgi:hypothetical protein
MSKSELLQRFAPIIYFHSNEKYFPVSIDFLLKNSTLKHFSKNTTIKSPSQLDIYSLAEKNNFQPMNDGYIVLSIDPLIKYGQTPISDVPLYAIYRTKNDKIYLTYILLLAHNGSYNILNITEVGSHPGDLEHITVELNKDEQLTRVFYSAHGKTDGRIVDAKDVPMENGRIVAYSALNGHGLYPSEGFAFRVGGLANDLLEKGIRWQPNVVELFPKDNTLFDKNTMGWTVYNGRLGGNLDKANSEGITGLSDKNWYGPTAKDIDDFDGVKLSYPPLISRSREKLLINIKSVLSLVLIYLFVFISINITNKYIKIFKPTSVLNHIVTLIIIMLLIITYNYIMKKIIIKYAPK